MHKILLVDDDDLFRKWLMLILTKWGHSVLEARNGKEAVRLYEYIVPDLVITDLIMPEKEGLETIDELRRKHPGVKIVAMSGGGRVTPADYLRIAKAMGANRVLAKPFTDEDLAAAIETLLAPTQNPS